MKEKSIKLNAVLNVMKTVLSLVFFYQSLCNDRIVYPVVFGTYVCRQAEEL